MADFLDEMLSNEAPQPDPEVPTPAPIVEEPAEAVAPEPEPTQPEVTPAEPQRPEAGFVPIAALLEERDKRKQYEDQVREYQARQQPQQTPAAIPDPYDDPQGFAAHNERLITEQATRLRFEFSDQFARQAHGAEAVEAATQWAQGKAQADPAFAMSYMQQQNPIDWIVQQHKRDALLSDIGDNMDDWFTREAAKRGYAMPSAPAVAATPVVAAPQATRPATPPRSIASDAAAPSAGRSENPMADLDAIFNRR